jgi:hypothetical protein
VLSSVVLNEFIEDDADEMVRTIEEVFVELAEDYLLNQQEVENIIDSLKTDLTGSTLKDMFASSNRRVFARNLMKEHVKDELKNRKRVQMPSEVQMQRGLRVVLEEMADSMAEGSVFA